MRKPAEFIPSYPRPATPGDKQPKLSPSRAAAAGRPRVLLHWAGAADDLEAVRYALRDQISLGRMLEVSNWEDLSAALQREPFDLCLAEDPGDSPDRLAILQWLQQQQPLIPIILLSGPVSAAPLVGCCRRGTADCVHRDELARLGPTMERVLAVDRERQEHRRQEAEWRNVEEGLRSSEARAREVESELRKLAAFPRLNPTALFEFAADGAVTYFNDAALTLAKATGATDPADILPPDSARLVRECLGGPGHRHVLETETGGRIISWSFYPIPSAGSVHVYASDVTDSRQAEARIREQAALLDRAQDAILVRDLQDHIVYWNRSAERILGWTEAEVSGRNADDLLAGEDRTRSREALETVLKQGEWRGELHQTAKSGKEVVMDSRWTLVRGGGGEPQSILVLATDITERKKLEAQFLRAQRLESIGTLASGIAHDLNNILAPILMSVNLLQESMPTGQPANLLEVLRASAQRGADMVRQILSFTRGQEGTRTLIQPKHLINEIAKISRETFPKKIQVRTDVAKDLWPVQADSTHIHQVLMNLCVNARDAMLEGGHLSIQARNLVLSTQSPERPPEIAPGDYVALTVADTGTGIPPELMEKIWEPFFTLKLQGQGTGLGLSTVLSIVKAHCGFVRAESEPGRGTRFHVFLPAAGAGSRVESVEAPTPVVPGRNEKILVVDDERAFQEITQAIFTRFGYRVLTAGDGTEAVALFSQQRDIDLVITDVVMPFLDGPATIRALRRIDPRVPIIVTSGLSEHEQPTEALTCTTFLLKPFTTEKLLATVRTVLEARHLAP